MKNTMRFLALTILFLLLSVPSVQGAESKFIKVNAGEDGHVVALKDDGTVWGWGENMYGCLGDGTASKRLVPTKVEGVEDVIDIAVGYYFTIALKSDGTVWGWGWNVENRLGIDIFETYVPVQIPNLKNIVEISADMQKTYALSNEGKVYVNCKESIYTDFKDNKEPTQLAIDKGFKVIKICNGSALGLKNDGTVWKWSKLWIFSEEDVFESEPEEIKDFKGCLDVAVGPDCFYIVSSDGRIFSYSENNSVGLGNGFTSFTNVPYKVEGVKDVKSVSSKDEIYVIHNNGRVSILYNGNKVDRFKKVNIDDVEQIIQTDNDVYALKKDGMVWTWGKGLRAEDISPKRVDELSDISRLILLDDLEGAIDNKGRVYIKRFTEYIQDYLHLDMEKNDENIFDLVNNIGDNSFSIQFLEFDVFYNSQENTALLSIRGSLFNKINLNESNIFVKFLNDSITNGQSLADFDKRLCTLKFKFNSELKKYTVTFKPVEGFEDFKDIKTIGIFNANTFLLREDGTVFVKGYNYACLGVDYKEYSDIPIQVQGIKNIKEITGGYGHCFAVDYDGDLYAWGDNVNEEMFESEFHKGSKEWKEVSKALVTLNVNMPKIYINGREKEIPAAPIILESRTLIPIREVIEGLGGSVEWNDESKKITVCLGDKTLMLGIDSFESELNGVKSNIDIAPKLINGKTYLPLRYVCESVGAKVLWEETVQKISIVY